MQVAHRHHAGAPDVIRRRADGGMLDGLHDRVRNRTTVEALGAQMSDPLVRLGERGVREHRAHVARRSIRVEEQRGAGRNIVEPVAVRVRLVEPHLVDDIAVTRDVNRRCEDLRQRHRPELLERVDPCLDRAGNSDGEPAVPRIVERQGHTVLPERHRMHGRRCGLTTIDRRHGAVCGTEDQEPAPADSTRERLGHAKHRCRRHGGIDRVAATTQDVDSHLRREPLHGRGRAACANRGGRPRAASHVRSGRDPECERDRRRERDE